MTTSLAIALTACFLSVALLTGLGLSRLLVALSPERRRLRQLAAAEFSELGHSPGSLVETLDPRLRRIPGLLPRSAKRTAHVERRLAAAGYTGPSALALFGAAGLFTPAVFGLSALTVFGFSGIAFAAAAAALGYVLPGIVLSRLIKHRKLHIQNGLPDALDLMTICVEAGSGLDQAIVKVTEEVRLTWPVLADELRMVATEIRAGKPRAEAFRDLADRTGVDEVRGVVNLLTQTDRFGTSIGQALRTHAHGLRTRRRQRAEERAAKIGAKLAFPLVLFLFPSLYIVVLGPVALQFLRVFHSAGW